LYCTFYLVEREGYRTKSTDETFNCPNIYDYYYDYYIDYGAFIYTVSKL